MHRRRALQGRAPSKEFGCRPPHLDELRKQYGTTEVSGHDSHDIVDSSHRRRPDRLKAVLVGGLADLVGELKVLADEIGWIDFESLQGCRDA